MNQVDTHETPSVNIKPVLWRVAEHSVRGPSHDRSGLPNQDAVGSSTLTVGDQTAVVLAVCDGHGSSKCFRSDIGSKCAVDAVISVLSDFVQREDKSTNAIPDELCAAWDAAVAKHLANNPVTQDELDILIKKDGISAEALVKSDPTVAYGATMLGAVALGKSITFIQLGDGDILCVDRNGDASRAFPADEKLIANETTSLCTDDAPKYVQVTSIDALEKGIELVLISSDGYANSFRTEKDFNSIGNDYLTMIRQTGLEWVSGQLDKILENTTRNGAGDDISLGILKLALDTDVDEITQKISSLEVRVEFAGDGLDDLRLQQADYQSCMQKMIDEETRSRTEEALNLAAAVKALEERLQNAEESQASVAKNLTNYKTWLMVMSIITAVLAVYLVLSK